MSYYDHATLMSLKLERWSDERFLPHRAQSGAMDSSKSPAARSVPIRREFRLVKALLRLGRPRRQRI